MKLIINETYYLKSNPTHSRNPLITPVTITKIGHKYFYVNSIGSKIIHNEKFEIDSLRHISPYGPEYTIYESEQTIKDEIEQDKHIKNILHFMRSDKAYEIPVETYRKIINILNNSEDKNV